MDLPRFKLERPEGKPRRGEPRKTRIFESRLLGYLTADPLWEAPTASALLHPVWIAYLGTDREAHAFTANLRAGFRASADGVTLEIPRRAPLRWSVQPVPGGVITVAYLPELFHLEPTDPDATGARFVLAPPRWWTTEQAEALALDLPGRPEEAAEAARAALFCAFLDRRTPLPLVHDLRFHLQLYRAALAAPWVHRPMPSRYASTVFHGRGFEACGLDEPLACDVDAATLAAFLIEQTALFHQKEIRRGTSSVPAARRLLSRSLPTPAQLRLDLEVA